MSSSTSGMWEVKTRSDHYGGITSRVTLRLSKEQEPVLIPYRTGTQGLIFVIDSNDRTRIDEARQELHRIILDREMKEALLLVFANKQDVPGGKLCTQRVPCWMEKEADLYIIAMTPNEVSERLKLSSLKDHLWNVVPSCATTGEGLFEGLVGYRLTLRNWLYT